MADVTTPEALRAAMESMFRLRAVESPPGEGGLRTVWHRGARHVELVSELDSEGRVARHAFSLFEDMVVWERGRGFVTGVTAEPPALDATAVPAKLERAAAALGPYAGRDRIIQHLRELVVSTQQGAQPTEDLGVVTGEHEVDEAPAPQPRSRALLWVGIGLVIVAVALAVLALK